MVKKWEPNCKSAIQTNYAKIANGGFRVIGKPWYQDRLNNDDPSFLREKHVRVCLIPNLAFRWFDGN